MKDETGEFRYELIEAEHLNQALLRVRLYNTGPLQIGKNQYFPSVIQEEGSGSVLLNEFQQAYQTREAISTVETYQGWTYFPTETIEEDPNKVQFHLRRPEKYLKFQAGPGLKVETLQGVGYRDSKENTVFSVTAIKTIEWQEVPAESSNDEFEVIGDVEGLGLQVHDKAIGYGSLAALSLCLILML